MVRKKSSYLTWICNEKYIKILKSLKQWVEAEQWAEAHSERMVSLATYKEERTRIAKIYFLNILERTGQFEKGA